MPIKEILGIIAYTVTPFNCSGGVNLSVLDNITENLINSGANAITALGSVGECVYLDDSEWQVVAKRSIEIVNKRMPIIIGISELSTSKASQKAIFAENQGADAIMLAPLKYYGLSEDEIYTYFSSVSDAVSIPVMLYNNPATSGIDMSSTFILSMVEGIKNICMVKDSSTDIRKIKELQSLRRETTSIFVGCNYLALDAMELGVAGWCTATPNLIGAGAQEIFNAVQQGSIEKARYLFSQNKALLKFLVEKGLARTVKAGLELKGVPAGKPRSPLRPLSTMDYDVLAMLLLDSGNQL